MGRIVLVTGHFPVYDSNGFCIIGTEFGTSHGIDEATGRTVITSTDHPRLLGATFDNAIQEWVIESKETES